MLELANKNIKAALLTLLGKNSENIKKTQTELLGIKTTMFEIKITLNVINH